LACFLLLIGETADIEKEKNCSELTGVGKLKEQLFSGLKMLGLK